MRRRIRWPQALFIIVSAVAATPVLGQEGPREAERPDELLFREAGLRADAKGLLAFLRKFTPTPKQRERIASLVSKLGDDDLTVRKRAEAELTEMGPAAAGALRRALTSGDAETVRVARRCLGRLGSSTDPELHEAAARRLAASGHADALPVLLDYLPEAPDAVAREEVAALIASLHPDDKDASRAVLAALKDGEQPCRRAAAARALGPAHAAKCLDALKALAEDADHEARLQAASALLRGNDRAGVPLLVALLQKAPLPIAWRAEAALRRVARAEAPAAALQGTERSRAACHAAWAEWWAGAAKTKVDLSAATQAPWTGGLAYVDLDGGRLVVLEASWKEPPEGQRIVVITPWRQIRKMEGLCGPTDFQLLPSGRALIAENHGVKVTERDESGKVVWEYRPTSPPVCCWRLDTGNTVVVCRKEIREVTPEGKTAWAKEREEGEIRFARRLRDGHAALLVSTGHLVTLDGAGREVTSREVESVRLGVPLGPGGFCLLPGGRCLLATQINVTEIDREGRPRHSFMRDGAAWRSPLRLDNGHTVVADHDTDRVLELDRGGRVVREHRTEGRVWSLQLVRP